ncbi:hypothetical protein QA811_33785 [Streptomyces sp. B21-102]
MSVQICKFGWGAAAMLSADPDGGHRTMELSYVEQALMAHTTR